MMKLPAVIAKPLPHGETEQGKIIKSSSFELPLFSHDTPTRPAMKPHYIVPGPAIEGPAEPSTSEHGIPIRMKLT
eukprot:3705737-Pyramimonas_sp.AAC.1